MKVASFNRAWFRDSEQLTLLEAMYENSISNDSLPSITTENQTNKVHVFILREGEDLDYCRHLCHT